MINKKIWFFLALLMLAPLSQISAQEEPEAPLLGPINSDPLTIRGISPRVLDIALFPMSQGLYWEMLLNYQSVGKEGEARSERFRMIFDPYTDYGRDLYFEFENEPLESLKRYKRSLEVTMGKDNYVRKKPACTTQRVLGFARSVKAMKSFHSGTTRKGCQAVCAG